jgi:hypothetical protein
MDTTRVVVLDDAGKVKRECVALFKHESELGMKWRRLDNLKSKFGASHYEVWYPSTAAYKLGPEIIVYEA